MYNPTLGSWLQQDPIGFDAGDMDLYRMEENNPTNEVDPSGLEAKRSDALTKLRKSKEAYMAGEAGKIITVSKETSAAELVSYFGGRVSAMGEEGKLALEAFKILLQVAAQTKRRGIPGADDVCVNWVSDVKNGYLDAIQSLPQDKRLALVKVAQKYFSIDTEAWKSYTTGIEHKAIKVTILGTNPPVVFYLDYTYLGGVGNDQRIFGPGDIPSSYMPINENIHLPRPNSFLEDILELLPEGID